MIPRIPRIRINVPAAKMSLLPDDLEHFQRWLEEGNVLAGDQTAVAANGSLFPRRGVLVAMLTLWCRLSSTAVPRHPRCRESGGSSASGRLRWVITGETGRRVEADILVIAHKPSIAPAAAAATKMRLPAIRVLSPDPTRPGCARCRPRRRPGVLLLLVTAADLRRASSLPSICVVARTDHRYFPTRSAVAWSCAREAGVVRRFRQSPVTDCARPSTARARRHSRS